MYTVLTGAKKNVGDYLITDRCKKLLREFKPEHELFQLPHWEPLSENLDKVNQSEAIIIMGGPGFQSHFYPGVYKLTPNLNDIEPPIIPMGLGWKGFPGDYYTLEKYQFTKESMEALKMINEEAEYISCRDYMTKEALENNGLTNVLMTGCPVWYELESIGKKFEKPKKINKLVFTPAQRHKYRGQSIQCIKILSELFPEAEKFCSFHRGIEADDKFTPKSDEKNNKIIMEKAETHGFNIVNAAFDLDKIEFYNDCDFHVGYRVHGHLSFISKRKPSILIHEDGRGRGLSQSINHRGVDAFQRTFMGLLADKLDLYKVSGGIKKAFGHIKVNENFEDILYDYITEELENGFIRFAGLSEIIDNHFEIMKKFIKSLP